MHREIDFEDAVVAEWMRQGYQALNPQEYDKAAALFPKEVAAFVQKSQPELWQRSEMLAKDAPILISTIMPNIKECP